MFISERKMRVFFFTVYTIIIISFVPNVIVADEHNRGNDGQLLVYIETPEFEDMDVTLTIDRLELISSDDNFSFIPRVSTLYSQRLSANQELIALSAFAAIPLVARKIYDGQ